MPCPFATEILKEAPTFVEQILEEIHSLKVDVASFPIDHICCRASTLEDYSRLKKEFLLLGNLLTEAPVSGRPIATFKLFTPLVVGLRTIPCLELPAPKPGSHYSTGLEHCEFVIEESFEDFTKRYPTLSWNWKGAKKSFNPELQLSLSENRAVKFHHLPLEKVIALEKAQLRSLKN